MRVGVLACSVLIIALVLGGVAGGGLMGGASGVVGSVGGVSGAVVAQRGGGYVFERGIAYRDTAGADAYTREKCRLDVYAPEGADDFVTVVWFHAGGLRMGERYVPGELRDRGYAVVAASYRLSPEVSAPAYIEDAAAAVAWVFENIERYGGSRDRVVVAGASAGGYLAMMLGLDKRWMGAHGIDADAIAGIGSLGGQAITHVAVRQERGIERTRAVIDDLAPLYHVRKDAPPMLLATGDRDLELLGRYEENALLARMMSEVGHRETELYELEGFDHAGLEKPAHGLLLRFLERFEPESR